MTELTPRPPVDRRTARLSIVVGAVVALLILVAGIAFALVRPPAYTAEAMAVVLPGKGLDEATALEAGMAEKSAEFADAGGKVYLPVVS